MSTPIINLVNNVNDSSAASLIQAMANNSSARVDISESDRNIDAIGGDNNASNALSVNDDAVRLALCRREGYDPSNFPTLSDVAADVNIMSDITARSVSSKITAYNLTAMQEVAASTTAMDEVVASGTALDEIVRLSQASQEIANSNVAMNRVSSNPTPKTKIGKSDGDSQAFTEIKGISSAVSKYMAGHTSLNPFNVTDLSTLSNDSSKMTTIGGNSDAITILNNSQTAINSLIPNSTSITALAGEPQFRSQIGSDNNGNNTYDKIIGDNVALGKYAAGHAGLSPSNYSDVTDLVSNGYGTLTSSSSGMDIVMKSLAGETELVTNGNHVSTMWESGTENQIYLRRWINPDTGQFFGALPVDVSGANIGHGGNNSTYTVKRNNEGPNGGYSMVINRFNDSTSGVRGFAEKDIDFTNFSSVSFYMRDNAGTNTSGSGGQGMGIYTYKVGNGRGSSTLEIMRDAGAYSSINNSWSSFSIDVSGYSGHYRLGLANDTNSNAGGDTLFANFSYS